MKELSATASDVSPAPIERCFELLADVEHYPDWYPAGVKRVEVLERDPDSGRATLVAAKLSLGDGPLRKEFNLQLAIGATSNSGVELTRVKKDAADGEQLVVAWALAQNGAEATQVSVELRAALELPPFLPVGPIAQSVADGFLAAAVRALSPALQ